MAHPARCFAAVGTLLGRGEWHTGSPQRPCETVASIEASVAPFWRHRFEAHRAAFEHGLQLVDSAIALFQTLGPAKAVGRAVAHAELFEAEPAAWCIVDESKPFCPSSAFWANKVAPRAAVREFRMGDADAFAVPIALLIAKGDNGQPVLEPDRAGGLEA